MLYSPTNIAPIRDQTHDATCDATHDSTLDLTPVPICNLIHDPIQSDPVRSSMILVLLMLLWFPHSCQPSATTISVCTCIIWLLLSSDVGVLIWQFYTNIPTQGCTLWVPGCQKELSFSFRELKNIAILLSKVADCPLFTLFSGWMYDYAHRLKL